MGQLGKGYERICGTLKLCGYAEIESPLSKDCRRRVTALIEDDLSGQRPDVNRPSLLSSHRVASEAYSLDRSHFSWLSDTITKNILPFLTSFDLASVIVQKVNPDPTGEGIGIPWHQDVGPEIAPGKVINLIHYPNSSRNDEACLWVVKGSHLKGDIPPGEPYGEITGGEELKVGANNMLVLDGKVFHCVPARRCGKARVSLVMRFVHRDFSGHADLDVGQYRTGSFNYRLQQTV